MKIVIDIPEEQYQDIMSYAQYLTPLELTHFEEVVMNGVPIPSEPFNSIISKEQLVFTNETVMHKFVPYACKCGYTRLAEPGISTIICPACGEKMTEVVRNESCN